MLHGALLLSVCTFAASLDFQLGSKPVGQSVFVRHSSTEERAAKTAKRSLSPSARHSVKRRSTEQDESCKGLRGYETKLADNTHQVSSQTEVLFHVAG